MSDTLFTNIETCVSANSSYEQQETQPAPPRLRDSTTPTPLTALSFVTLRTAS